MNPQLWWQLTRASGIVAWLMMTASILWGIVLATKAFPEHRRPAWLLDLHRWLGGLAVAFLAIHLGALLADSYVSFDVLDLLVPFRASWKPGAVALGVVALWLLVAVQATSMAMRRLPRRRWRQIHMSSYVVFALTSLHAAFAGSDTSAWLYQVTSAVVISAVAAATMYRVLNRRSAAATAQPTARKPRTASPNV